MNDLEKINNIMLEELNRLKNIDLSNEEMAKTEILRCNAISLMAKTIIQLAALQTMIDTKRVEFKSNLQKLLK